MTTTTTRRTAVGDLVSYLDVLAGGHAAGRLIEIRYPKVGGGMRQLFVPARRPELAASAIASLADHGDVYTGVLLRTRRAGGRDAVARSHLVFAEIDQPDALQRLRAFAHQPTMIIASGIIRSRRAGARGAAGDRRWRHVADGVGRVDARRTATTYDMYDLSGGGVRRGRGRRWTRLGWGPWR